jgi:hypothetical protein
MRMIARFRAAIRRRRARAAARSALPEGGLPDLGLSRADLEAALRMDADRIARMRAMAGVHGLAPEVLAADRRLALDIARTCARCPDDAACRAAFARPGGPDPADTGFCPNAGTHRALRDAAV